MEKRKYPREFLLTELKRVAKLLVKIPTIEEFNKESEIAAVTIAKRFGGWRAALLSAGFDPQKSRLTYQDIEIVEELQKVANDLGRTPSTREFDDNSSLSSSTIIGRLGSWKDACKLAGLKPYVSTKPPKVPAGWNKGQRKLTISKDDLQYLYEVEGMSASAIALRLNVHRNTVLRSMKEFGIEIKKLHYSMPRATSIEEKLYAELERRGVTFVKQQVIDGLWVVDALIPGARIVIECDGEYWHSLPAMQDRDKKKDNYLRSRKYKVFRFPEAAIHADVKKCVQKIVDALVDRYKED
jgi:very-short-patch-repair endonuclease